jgi:hypothetical protein
MILQHQRTQEALRALPSAGWIGRRDRAVHVLSWDGRNVGRTHRNAHAGNRYLRDAVHPPGPLDASAPKFRVPDGQKAVGQRHVSRVEWDRLPDAATRWA